jgi:chromosome segregation ATPase
MKMIEDFKKGINDSLKEIEENRGRQVEALKDKTHKSLKEIQENTRKQVKEVNNTIQNLKMEIETTKKSQRETTLEIENLGKRSRVMDASITKRKLEIKERISRAEDTIEDLDTIVKKKCKMQNAKSPNPKHPRNPGHNEKTKPKNNRYKRDRRFLTQKASKHLQQNYRRKLP